MHESAAWVRMPNAEIDDADKRLDGSWEVYLRPCYENCSQYKDFHCKPHVTQFLNIYTSEVDDKIISAINRNEWMR